MGDSGSPPISALGAMPKLLKSVSFILLARYMGYYHRILPFAPSHEAMVGRQTAYPSLA